MSITLRAAVATGLIAVVAPSAVSAQEPAAELAPVPVAVEEVLEAVSTIPDALSTLEARTDLAAEDVQVVVVDDLFAEEHAGMLDEALTANGDALVELRTAVAANAAITAALAQVEGVTADDAVAIRFSDEDGTVVYVQRDTGG